MVIVAVPTEPITGRVTPDFVRVLRESILYGNELGIITAINLVTENGEITISSIDKWWDSDTDYIYLIVMGSVYIDKPVNVSEIQVILSTTDRGELIIARTEKTMTLYAFHTYTFTITIQFNASLPLLDYILCVFEAWTETYPYGNIKIDTLYIYDANTWDYIETRNIIEYDMICPAGENQFPCVTDIRVRDDSNIEYDIGLIEVYNTFGQWLFDIEETLHKYSDDVLDVVINFALESEEVVS